MRKFKIKITGQNFEDTVADVTLSEYIGWKVKMMQSEKSISNYDIMTKGGFKGTTVISRIKKGKHSIQVDTIYRLCKGLACNSTDILPF